MKQRHINVLLGLCFGIALFSSCTIQKRTVNRGYFVQWNRDKKIKNGSADAKEELSIRQENAVAEETEILASSETGMIEPASGMDTPGDSQALPELAAESKPYTQKQAVQKIAKQVSAVKPAAGKILEKIKRTPPPMDWELTINIVLTAVFLALAILFTLLAIKAAAGLMLFVWGILALVSFVLFVTQVIDLIMW